MVLVGGIIESYVQVAAYLMREDQNDVPGAIEEIKKTLSLYLESATDKIQSSSIRGTKRGVDQISLRLQIMLEKNKQRDFSSIRSWKMPPGKSKYGTRLHFSEPHLLLQISQIGSIFR